MSLSSSAPWLKYYGNVPHHLSYPQKTIYQMVKAAAERNPKLPAYEFMGKKTTFAQFMQKIDETAQAFLAMGIKKGDRVTVHVSETYSYDIVIRDVQKGSDDESLPISSY